MFVPVSSSDPLIERTLEAHTYAANGVRLKNHYWAVLPPSTRYDAPVMNDALSDARNMMV
jgi:hypothetical protein